MKKSVNDHLRNLVPIIKSTPFLLAIGITGLSVLANVSYRDWNFTEVEEVVQSVEQEKIRRVDDIFTFNAAVSAAQSIEAPTGDWIKRIVDVDYDIANDGFNQADLLGNGDSVSNFLHTQQDGATYNMDNDTIYYFRTRVGQTGLGTTVGASIFMGIDIDTNDVPDFYLEARFTPTDSSVYFHTTGMNQATTPNDVVFSGYTFSDTILGRHGFLSVDQVMDAPTDLDADGTGNDVYANFGFSLYAIDSFVNAAFSAPYDTVYGNRRLGFVFFSADTLGPILDVAGVNGGLNQSWSSDSVFVYNSLNGITLGDNDEDGFYTSDPDNEDACVFPSLGAPEIAVTSLDDCDEDGVTDAQEYNDGTDNLNPCDFALASFDVDATGSSWRTGDCDGDNISNSEEMNVSSTDSLDLDGDGIGNYMDTESDGDGVLDSIENLNSTNFLDSCDFQYLAADSMLQVDTLDGMNSVSSSWRDYDCDGDGVSNITEIRQLTDPTNACDFDTIGNSGDIITAIGNEDCDGDGVINELEIILQTNPLDSCDFVTYDADTLAVDTLIVSQAWLASDCDGDGVSNRQEILDSTEAADPCSFLDSSIVLTPSTAWLSSDCDGDGVSNGVELADSTGILDSCDLIFWNRDLVPTTSWNALDCDGDGLINSLDGDSDMDQDSLPNFQDLDSDGDGVPDTREMLDTVDDPCLIPFAELATHVEDSILAHNISSNFWMSLDCDGDGISNLDEGTGFNDYDGDGIPNFQDLDSDGDGVLDQLEWLGTNPTDFLDSCAFVAAQVDTLLASLSWLNGDCDGDGNSNIEEIRAGTGVLDPCDLTIPPSPGSATDNWEDADCDMDGITNFEEGYDDTDADGVYNINDLDSDGDGVLDTIEQFVDMTDPYDECDFEWKNSLMVLQIDTSSGTTAQATMTWMDSDCDGDGVNNMQELRDNTDPLDTCSFLLASFVYDSTSVDWRDLDCDSDSLTNGEEMIFSTMDSLDLDGDGVPNFMDLDSDGDGQLDSSEFITGNNPFNFCDYENGSIPNPNSVVRSEDWKVSDCDGDGVTNFQELQQGTNELDSCDLIWQAQSVPDTSWMLLDCDNDGISNGVEFNYLTSYYGLDTIPRDLDLDSVPNFLDWDSDGDGVPDSIEFFIDSTNAYDACDFLWKDALGAIQVDTSSMIDDSTATLAWRMADCDGDGVTNYNEIINGTDPTNGCDLNPDSITLTTTLAWRNADCDGDGIRNGLEGIGDIDGDGILNINDLDSDQDGVTDAVEVFTDSTDAYDPCDLILTSQIADSLTAFWLTRDCDGDGVDNGQEHILSGDETDPLDPCDYKLSSQAPNSPTGAWLAGDCDGDGVSNGIEIDIDSASVRNPCVFPLDSVVYDSTSMDWRMDDCDGDGVINGQEILDATDPLDTCDYLINHVNGSIVSAGWEVLDCDGDGLLNSAEILDNDGDGIINGIEQDSLTDMDNGCDFILSMMDTSLVSQAWKDDDCDGDGVTNMQEYIDTADFMLLLDSCYFELSSFDYATTDPQWRLSDCDGDGLNNGTEMSVDVSSLDMDGDGVANYLDLDSDGDGMSDSLENENGFEFLDICSYDVNHIDSTTLILTLWNVEDCDSDGLTNEEEVLGATDPLNPDSDGDGVLDGTELADSTDPLLDCDFVQNHVDLDLASASWLAADCDEDGVKNNQEVVDSTDAHDWCKFEQAHIDLGLASAAWKDEDCDGDGVSNEQEVLDTTDAKDNCDLLFASQNLIPDAAWLAADCDGDGLVNAEEINLTDTTYIDSDGDGMPDFDDLDKDGDGMLDAEEETNETALDPCQFDQMAIDTSLTLTDWRDDDCDGDGISNLQEFIDSTLILDGCSFDTAGFDFALTSADWKTLDCDEDGIDNGDEVAVGLDDSLDVDQDGFFNFQDIDSDGDGVEDAVEEADGTDRYDDCDFLAYNALEGLQIDTTNGMEGSASANWRNSDCDGDGVINIKELRDGTNPKDSCDLLVNSVDSLLVSLEWMDGDCDEDGITNGEEGYDDLDEDEIPNFVDTDSDGDGVLDVVEFIVDSTSYLNPCIFNPDSVTLAPAAYWNALDCDMDGIDNAEEGIADLDEDGTPNFMDVDADGDGVLDTIEWFIDSTEYLNPCEFEEASIDLAIAAESWKNSDCDGDGVINEREVLTDFTNPLDNCDLEVNSITLEPSAEWLAGDCDMDGLTNEEEGITDFDGDGIPNFEDVDADGDGHLDSLEVMNGFDPYDPCDFDVEQIYDIEITAENWRGLDCDQDGVNNYHEVLDGTDPFDPCDLNTENQGITVAAWNTLDCDADGLLNGLENLGNKDIDEDGIPNFLDLDSDGDGVLDQIEVTYNTSPFDPCDFVANLQQVEPTDSWNNDLDCDGDGVSNGQEIADTTYPFDPCDLLLTSQLASDLNPSAAWRNADCDGDGVLNGMEYDNGTVDTSLVGDFDEDGLVGFLDVDSDGDGVMDGMEDADCYFTRAGLDVNEFGCALEQLDTDNDGVTDDIDECPDTPADEIARVDSVGCAPSQLDNDNDGVIDSIDLCPNTPDSLIALVDSLGCAPIEVDKDGDGVRDDMDSDSLNPCVFDVDSITLIASAGWLASDCDGDGYTNGEEGVMDYDMDSIPNYLDEDADGDGVLDSLERTDGTAYLNECSLKASSVVDSLVSDFWKTGDCDDDGYSNEEEGIDDLDGDGISNFNDADSDGDGVMDEQESIDSTYYMDPCEYLTINQVTSKADSWLLEDCDGDGVTNGDEEVDGTDPNDLCSYQLESQGLVMNPDSLWMMTDCDGDGVTNGQEELDGTSTLDLCDVEFASIQEDLLTQEWKDADCDGDGLTNDFEGLVDTDGDLIPDFKDDDSDDDGILDLTEGDIDLNNDGVLDYLQKNTQVPEDEEVKVFSGISPNGDGLNDFLIIYGADQFPDNYLTILNRMGIVVYEQQGYGQNGNYFYGIPSGGSEVLPDGVYFYVFEYTDGNGVKKQVQGYFHINR